ncbi:hypothetical protein [Methylocella sp.]|uniref:hypothetical protein n=1 Tax=Methylocella sp. TaxID=1978226 RepID=UPI0035AE752F
MLPLPSSLAVLAASYSVHRTRKTLQIEEIAGGRRTVLEEIVVSGRQEARQIAAARGARCWNF